MRSRRIAPWLACAAATVAALTAPSAHAQAPAARLVLVTIDGYRWQDLFRGADPALVTDARYRARYVDVPDRAGALTPFLLSFSEHGALIGNRDAGSCAQVANDYWFSYPGYAELLSGRPNPRVRSNQATANDDVTVLERLSKRPEFAGQIAVFAEWNVVPAILNVARSGLDVFIPPDEDADHDPQVIAAVRAAMTAPTRLTWIALGDTDNFAHAGDYEGYLRAASEADMLIAEIWRTIEADADMSERTTMIVTADHGRGESQDGAWRGHGSGRWRGMHVPGLHHEGSDAIFIAARGPGIAVGDPYKDGACARLAQVTATLLASLGLADEEIQPDMAAPLDIFEDASALSP